MHLARFPRLHLAHLPTPLERMPRLSKELCIDLWITRDDRTSLPTGGNRTRKLEFLMAGAGAKGADMVMTRGATQSNHVRQTATFTAEQEQMVCDIVARTAGKPGCRDVVKREDVIANADCLGEGFGHTDGTVGLFGYDFAFDHENRRVHV